MDHQFYLRWSRFQLLKCVLKLTPLFIFLYMDNNRGSKQSPNNVKSKNNRVGSNDCKNEEQAVLSPIILWDKTQIGAGGKGQQVHDGSHKEVASPFVFFDCPPSNKAKVL